MNAEEIDAILRDGRRTLLVRRIAAELVALDPADRCRVLNVACEKICLDCGEDQPPRGRCTCTLDKEER